jgi:hypothetical protein
MSIHNDNYVHNDEELLSMKFMNIKYKYKLAYIRFTIFKLCEQRKRRKGLDHQGVPHLLTKQIEVQKLKFPERDLKPMSWQP